MININKILTPEQIISLRIRSDEAVIGAFPRASLTDTSNGKELFDLCEKHWQSVIKTLSENDSLDNVSKTPGKK